MPPHAGNPQSRRYRDCCCRWQGRALIGDTALGTTPRDEIPPFEPIVWKSLSTGILATYQIVNDLYVRLGYEWRNVSGEQEYIEQWTAEEYHGKTGTLRLGMNFGF